MNRANTRKLLLMNWASIFTIQSSLSDRLLITFLTFSDNKHERYIMDLYRIVFQKESKVKRQDLWNRVQSSEHPIAQKYFDTILRRFCFSQGQSWLLKPKLK